MLCFSLLFIFFFSIKGETIKEYFTNTTAGYNYRKDILIENKNSSVTIDRVLLQLDTQVLYDYSETDDCGDYRFKTVKIDDDWDSEVPFWMENECPSSQTNIWLFMEVQPLEKKMLYLFMGINTTKEIKTHYSMDYDGTIYSMSSTDSCGDWDDADTDLLGYFPVSEDGKKFGEKSGTPYDGSHEHPLAVDFENTTHEDYESVKGSLTSTDYSFGDHHHKTNITLKDQFFPPYYYIKLCQSNGNHSIINIEKSHLFFFENDDWEEGDFEINEDLENHMLMFSDKYGVGDNIYDDVHNHSLKTLSSTITEFDLKYVEKTTTGEIACEDVHQHELIIQTNTSSHIPQRLSVIVGTSKKLTSKMCDSMIIMADSEPPAGWESYTKLNNYYIMGGKTLNLEPNGNELHYHNITKIKSLFHVCKNSVSTIHITKESVINDTYLIFNHNHEGGYLLKEPEAIENNFYPKTNVKFFKRSTKNQEYLNITLDKNIYQIKKITKGRDLTRLIVIISSIGGGVLFLVLFCVVIILIIALILISRSLIKKKKKKFDEKIKEETIHSAVKEVELMEEREELSKEMGEREKEVQQKKEEEEKLRLKLEELEKKRKMLQEKVEATSTGKGTIVRIDEKGIDIGKKIGEGSIGYEIFKGSLNNETVLIRVFNKNIFENEEINIFQFFESELNEYSSMKHPNILNYIAYTKPPKVCVVTEYCKNGHLKGFILKKKAIEFKEKVRILGKIADGMKYIHEKGLIHRDLRSENIYITEDLNVKIDFGFNRTFKKKYENSVYAAPELIDDRDAPSDDEDFEEHEKFDKKCDVFSFSIILFELITCNFSPYGMKNEGIGKKVAEDPSLRPNIQKLAKRLPNWVVNLCTNCWNDDGAERLSFVEICQIFEQQQ